MAVYNLRANRLSVVRGDHASWPLEITYVDGTSFLPENDGEKIVFTVRAGAKSEEYPVLIQKEITGTRIELEPADTESLDYGAYIYDVECTWLEDETLKTKTVIVGQMDILAEVT